MDFLSSREKDPLSTKYSTFPGWHSSHIFQRNPFTATYLKHPANYNSSTGEPKTWLPSGTNWNIHDVNQQNEISKAIFPSQSKLSHRELIDHTDKVRREKQSSNKGRYRERDIHEQQEGWETTWPMNSRGKREKCGTNGQKELQAYANCYHRALTQNTSGFEVGECDSGIQEVLGCGQWVVNAQANERFQPAILTSHKKDKTDLSNTEREQWRTWSTWNSRNMESTFPIASFRQPPSYTAPPAYSFPKDGGKLAGIPRVTAQESMEAFREQTFESRRVNFLDSTETGHSSSTSNGHYLQNNNQTQNTENYRSDLTDEQRHLEALNTACATAIKTKPSSPQAQLQYRESSELTYPDISRTKQTKPARRKGGETVFCLVSRMGALSGLSSSPEEPLKPHVLPLLTDPKPDDMTILPEQTNSAQCNDDSRQNQDEYPKDEAVRQFGEYGYTPLEHTGGDQRPSCIQDFSNVIKSNENKQDLQCHVQRNSSQSCCFTQKSYVPTNTHEKPCRETIEKFPLWKEPTNQHYLTRQRNEQHPGINDESKATNTKDQSLVVIDATCVVVKVELVLLPEKEHVQYVCLAEESPLSCTREVNDVQKQIRSVISSQETRENSTLDKGEERSLGAAHEYPRTGLQTYESISQEHISSCTSNIKDPIKKFEESPSAAESVDDWQVMENKLMVRQHCSGEPLENNEGLEETLNTTKEAKAPEAALEVSLINAQSISEVSEETKVQMNQATNQEKGPRLDDSVVKEDHENHRKYALPKDLAKEENLSDEVFEGEDLVLCCSKPLLKTGAGNAIKETQHGVHKVGFASIVGFSTLRRSSSSPHLSFTSAGSHTLLLPSSTNSKETQYSSLPSLSSTPVPVAFEQPSPSKRRSMAADVLLCTSSPPEHKQKTQHSMSLWDVVSRIRKHTAPDSETEEEEVAEFGDQTEGVDADLLCQRLNTEHE